MSPIADKDKYVVYDGTEGGMASFILFNRNHDKDFDRPSLEGGVTMNPDDVPEGTEYEDHFWVELNEDREITALEPAPEMHEQMKEHYQETAEIFDEWQKRDRQELEETDGE